MRAGQPRFFHKSAVSWWGQRKDTRNEENRREKSAVERHVQKTSCTYCTSVPHSPPSRPTVCILPLFRYIHCIFLPYLLTTPTKVHDTLYPALHRHFSLFICVSPPIPHVLPFQTPPAVFHPSSHTVFPFSLYSSLSFAAHPEPRSEWSPRYFVKSLLDCITSRCF